jgi:hypothetical protein
MTIKKITLLFATVAILSSCSKDNSTTGGNSSSNTGTISWVNNSNNPYELRVNNSYVGSISGLSYYDQEKNAGSYSYKLTQQSGYILYPTVLTGNVNVEKGKKVVLSFP